jgi:hypothetical protein
MHVLYKTAASYDTEKGESISGPPPRLAFFVLCERGD